MHQATAHGRLPELDIEPPARQRRITVLLRGLLLIPHFIVLWILGIVTFFAAIAAWFAALALGRLPDWAVSYMSGYIRYYTRVGASLYLLVDSYPPFRFTVHDSPVGVELFPGHLNRLAVFFRILLALPAIIVSGVARAGWHVLSIFSWLAVLILGRTPVPLFDATAAILRYDMRLQAYVLMLTSSYPKRLFGDRADRESTAPAEGGPSATHPLRLATAGKALLAAFVVFGILGVIGGGVRSGSHPHSTSTAARP